MARTDERDDVNAEVGAATPATLPMPTAEFRRRAWIAFSAALDRHLAAARDVRPVATQR